MSRAISKLVAEHSQAKHACYRSNRRLCPRQEPPRMWNTARYRRIPDKPWSLTIRVSLSSSGNHKQLRDGKGMPRTKNQSNYIHGNSPRDNPKNRPRGIRNIKKLIILIIKYCTLYLVMLSFRIFERRHRLPLRNTTLSITGISTNNQYRIFSLLSVWGETIILVWVKDWSI